MPDCAFVQRLDLCPACGAGWMEWAFSFDADPVSTSGMQRRLDTHRCSNCGFTTALVTEVLLISNASEWVAVSHA